MTGNLMFKYFQVLQYHYHGISITFSIAGTAATITLTHFILFIERDVHLEM